MRGQALTEAIVRQKTNEKVATVRKLNVWGCNLSDISLVAKMPKLEIASFSVNKICGLEPFSHCPCLTELFLRNNEIADFEELRHLAGLRNLKTVWLYENPISREANYRERVIEILPNLVRLDEADIELERQSLMTSTPRTGRITQSFPDLEPTEAAPERAPRSSRGPREKSRRSTHHKSEGQVPSLDLGLDVVKVAEPVRGRSSDKAIVGAILTLLPELSPDGLAQIARAVRKMRSDGDK